MKCKIISSVFVTAVLVAGPVLGSPAEAASVKSWDRVAKCESGGRWGIDSGNGYYGGLQIAPGTWESYGGKKFGSNASKASKREQIKVAEKIRAGQGWGAWGSCGWRR